MANFAQSFSHTVGDLPDPAILAKEQYNEIKAAIDELQAKVITGVSNTDNELSLDFHDNSLSINFSKPSANVPATDSTVVTLASNISWDGSSLSYVPISLYFGEGGRLWSMEQGEAVIIDTAEDCTCE